MQLYLVFLGAALFYAFIAPLKVTVFTCVLLLFVATAVRVSTQAIANFTPSFAASLKAVGLAFFFTLISAFTFTSFSRNTGISHFSGLPGLAASVGFYFSYTLGFKFGLGTTFGSSALIAFISTVITVAFILIAKNFL